MSRERELLEQALDELVSQDIDLRSEFETSREEWEPPNIIQEISKYLASEEPEKREPLRDEEIFNLYNEHEEETSVHSTIFHFNEFARAIEARVLQREPLKKEQIEKGFQETGYREGESRGRCFVLGVRFAEKHHGIQEEE